MGWVFFSLYKGWINCYVRVAAVPLEVLSDNRRWCDRKCIITDFTVVEFRPAEFCFFIYTKFVNSSS